MVKGGGVVVWCDAGIGAGAVRGAHLLACLLAYSLAMIADCVFTKKVFSG